MTSNKCSFHFLPPVRWGSAHRPELSQYSQDRPQGTEVCITRFRLKTKLGNQPVCRLLKGEKPQTSGGSAGEGRDVTCPHLPQEGEGSSRCWPRMAWGLFRHSSSVLNLSFPWVSSIKKLTHVRTQGRKRKAIPARVGQALLWSPWGARRQWRQRKSWQDGKEVNPTPLGRV